MVDATLDSLALSEKLQAQLAKLNPAEQEIIADLIERSKKQPDSTFHAVTLIHQYLKADPAYTDFTVYENLGQLKAPNVIKEFPEAPVYELTKDFLPMDKPLDELLAKRSSQHNYGSEAINLQTLSTFLHYSYGIKRYITAYNHKEFPVRQAPSAGGLQPNDIYLVVNSVEGLPKGLYHYNPRKHALELLDEGNMRSEMVRNCIYTESVFYAPVICILTIDMNRVIWKYGERSYRTAQMDTGVLVQNMYLVGTALNLNVSAVAAYYDDRMNEMLQLDGKNEFVSLLFPMGHKPFGGFVPEHLL